MKALKIVGLLSVLVLLPGTQARAAMTYGVEFLGRDGSGASGPTSGNPGTPGVGPNDSAGVIPQQFWNLVNDYNGSIGPEQGESAPLNADSSGSLLPTSVTLTFDCNDSWYNEVAPTNISSPNAHLMNGIIKSSASGGVPGAFTFNNLPDGQYDLYVYTDMNGDKTIAKFWDADNLITYYAELQHQFRDTNAFIQSSAMDVASATNIANYVKFSNLGTYGRGSLGVYAQWVSGNDGIGIAALQLVASPALINTNPVSILKQPASRRVLVGDTNVTFSVFPTVQATAGPIFSYQWYTNGAPVPGATTASVLAPPVVASDNGTAYYVIISNNVNNVKSANAILTVGGKLLPGVQEQLWYGAVRTNVEDGSHDWIVPDRAYLWPSFSSPEEQGDNFAERLSCLFTPTVAGNYTFFITSDDDSDLFISTDSTPAHKTLIAQETAWSNPFEWVSDAGGGLVSQKRSDQWTNGAGVVVNPNGIPLAAGTSYYLEAVHHEGGGGDKCDVTFKIVGETDPTNGAPSRLTSAVCSTLILDGAYIVITNQPLDETGPQSRTTNFTVGATGGYFGDSVAAPSVAYQWQGAAPGSSTFTNIPGANGTSITTSLLNLSDEGTQFKVVMTAIDATTNSRTAILHIAPDVIPPRPVSITGVGADAMTVILTFDELMDTNSTQTASGYTFNPGNIVATNASLASDGVTVTLKTGAPLTQNVTNVLAITGAKDLAGNLPAPNTTISFTFQLLTYQADIQFDQPIAYFRFEEPPGTAVATNSGTSGVDGAYYIGNEATTGAGGQPDSASGDAGPRPPAFKGFPADNHSATFDGPNSTNVDINGVTAPRWVDAKRQYLQNLPAFSLEYWVQPTNRVADPTAFGTRIGIVGQNDAIEYGFIDQNTIQIWTPNGGSLNTTYSFPDNTWHHVATIASGTDIRNYFDGVLINTGGNPLGAATGYGTSAYNVHIGGGGVFDPGNNWFTGNIDEVAIFDKAIPAARIAEHYSAGKIGGAIITVGAVTPPLGTSGPTLSFSRSGNTLTISWAPAGGTLQSTTVLNGASTIWSPVGTANPATITIGTGNSYYRVAQ